MSGVIGVACLMEKGVIIGVEHEAATRVTLPFVMFRTVTSVRMRHLETGLTTYVTSSIDPPVSSSYSSLPPTTITAERIY